MINLNNEPLKTSASTPYYIMHLKIQLSSHETAAKAPFWYLNYFVLVYLYKLILVILIKTP